MKKEDYTATIVVNSTANNAFKSINQVAAWWSENLEGSFEKLNDVFTMHAGDTFVTMQIIEFVPDKKVVWNVTDCYLHWLADKEEWKGTRIVFEISAEGDSTRIQFTHVGLEPQVECFDVCVKGWDQYIKDSLYRLITEGQGRPQKKVKVEAELAN